MKTSHTASFKDITTFKIGGPIHTYSELQSVPEAIEVFQDTSEHFLLIGGGSNILAKDEPYGGTVYKITASDIKVKEGVDHILISAEAGVSWDELVRYAVENGWWGLENLSAIPGTVGGAVFQNIGAYGAVLSNTLVSVTAFDVYEKKVRTFSERECLFGYRTSVFKQSSPRYVILAAECRLKKNGEPNIAYKDLALQFAHDPSPRLSALRTAVRTIRKKKFPDVGQYGTAGSFFLNPVVSAEEAVRFQYEYPEMPLFSMPEGGVKIPLAWILDHVIDAKDMQEGGAFVWKEQALVIATNKNATARDVHILADSIRKKVFEKTRIKIFPEVRIV